MVKFSQEVQLAVLMQILIAFLPIPEKQDLTSCDQLSLFQLLQKA